MNTIGYLAGLYVDTSNTSERVFNDAKRQTIAGQGDAKAGEAVTFSKQVQSGDADKVAKKMEETIISLEDMAPLALPSKADFDAFQRNFQKALDEAGIDSSIPIELAGAYDGSVKVINEHPDKEKIEKMFAENSDLQQGFVAAQTYQTLQKLNALHQQWQQKLEAGESEEAANLWLTQAAQSMVANSNNMTFKDGHIVEEGRTKADSAMQVIADLQAIGRSL